MKLDWPDPLMGMESLEGQNGNSFQSWRWFEAEEQKKKHGWVKETTSEAKASQFLHVWPSLQHLQYQDDEETRHLGQNLLENGVVEAYQYQIL